MSRRILFIFGAGGHGKVVANAARLNPVNEVRAHVDDSPGKIGTKVGGLPVIASKDLPPHSEVAPAIGLNRARHDICIRLIEEGHRLVTVIHPTAVITPGSTLGDGTFVGPLAVVHSDARVGRGCIINSGAIVEHDNVLEDWVHVSPNGTLGGNVSIGEGSHIGMSAAVLPGLRVGRWSMVGAGAVVIRDIADGVTAVGVPSKVIRGKGTKR
jgi:acetyltransferase EpsM